MGPLLSLSEGGEGQQALALAHSSKAPSLLGAALKAGRAVAASYVARLEQESARRGVVLSVAAAAVQQQQGALAAAAAQRAELVRWQAAEAHRVALEAAQAAQAAALTGRE